MLQTTTDQSSSRLRPADLLSGLLLAGLLTWLVPVQAAEATRADLRSITVESTLKDLSQANDAAIQRGHINAVPGKDALGQPRTDLVVDPPAETAAVVQGEVQSSLHKLKRETAHGQSADGRKARVEDSLDRTAEAAADAYAAERGRSGR